VLTDREHFKEQAMLGARDERAIAQTSTSYVQPFQTLNPHIVLSYCHVAYLLISPQGIRLMETPAEVEALFIRLKMTRSGKGG
jgi:hypothetical protein